MLLPVMGEQIAVLVLLTLAFAGGWYWRGDGTKQEDAEADLVALLERGSRAISDVLASVRASASVRAGAGEPEEGSGDARTLRAELQRLRAVEAELEAQLGGENPLTVDAKQAVEAATLIETELSAHASGGREAATGPGALIGAYEAALSDARMRFVRGAEVATLVLRGRGPSK